jgi:hypothetical protein
MTGIAMPACLPALHSDGRDGQRRQTWTGHMTVARDIDLFIFPKNKNFKH